MSQSTKPTSNADTAQPVAMELVIAQPLPKSINFAALGATPSAASGEAPSSGMVTMEAKRENRDMRAGAGDGWEKADKRLSRQPPSTPETARGRYSVF